MLYSISVSFAGCSLLQNASASDKLCVDGHTVINRIYVDGKSYTKYLANRKDSDKCVCFAIPSSSGTIAVEATSNQRQYGIHLCVTHNPKVFDQWRCRPARWKNADWYLDRQGRKTRHWKRAKPVECQRTHCQHYFKMPCQLYQTKCYWANRWRSRKKIRCIKRSEYIIAGYAISLAIFF